MQQAPAFNPASPGSETDSKAAATAAAAVAAAAAATDASTPAVAATAAAVKAADAQNAQNTADAAKPEPALCLNSTNKNAHDSNPKLDGGPGPGTLISHAKYTNRYNEFVNGRRRGAGGWFVYACVYVSPNSPSLGNARRSASSLGSEQTKKPYPEKTFSVVTFGLQQQQQQEKEIFADGWRGWLARAAAQMASAGVGNEDGSESLEADASQSQSQQQGQQPSGNGNSGAEPVEDARSRRFGTLSPGYTRASFESA
ncbi:hypothetical protein T492DRAFT_1139079, partial [Pavlovales sp. CCMP2436]